MTMQQATFVHKGYMVLGEELSVPGGFTVHFKRNQRKYFVLQYLGPNNLLLHCFKDEKSFKKPRSATPLRKRSSGTCSTICLVSALKVHKVEMKTKKKMERVLILVNGSHPKYFRPENKAEMDEWYKAFLSISTDTKLRSRQRPNMIDVLRPDTPHRDGVDEQLATNLTHFNLRRDSGMCSSTSSPRSSQGSSRSSSSSEDTISFSPPPSPNILPTSVFFDPGDSDDNSTTTTTAACAGFGARKVDWRKSFFIRGQDGRYEERPVDDNSKLCTTSLDTLVPGRSKHTGHPQSSASAQDEETRAAANSPTWKTDSNDDRVDEAQSKQEPVYDRLPIRHIACALSSDNTNILDEQNLKVPKKTRRNSRQNSQDAADDVQDSQPLPPRTKQSNIPGFIHSPEMEEILNDDGTKHTYINQRNTTKRSSRCSITDFGQEVEYLAEITRNGKTLSRNLEEPPNFIRQRAGTMPQSHHESQSEGNCNGGGDEVLLNRPLPKPELHLSMDIETLMWEQAQDTEVLVLVAKADIMDSLALVDVRGKVWVAGWKPTCTKNVYGKLHVGDQLLQVNDQVVNQAEWANTFVKTSSKTKITLHIRRLQHAKIVNCKRANAEIDWGLDVKLNEVKDIRPGPAKDSGLTTKKEGAFTTKQNELFITEIAHQPIKLNCAKDDVKRHLETKSLELPIVLHPRDFVKELNSVLLKMKHASQYQVG